MCCSLEIQDAKWCKKSPSEHHRTTLWGYIFAIKACVDNRKKIVKQQYLPQMSLQYGELRPSNGWDRLAGLGHPIIFQRLLRLGSVTARQSSSGRQPDFAALNRGCHLCSAGRPSRWALAHILVCFCAVRFGRSVGLSPKILDNESQPSLNGSPRNLHTSLVWGQAWKSTCENFSTSPLKIWRGKTSNFAELPPTRRQSKAHTKRLNKSTNKNQMFHLRWMR